MLTGDQIEKMLTRMADKLEGEALQELTLILTEVATIIVDEEIKRHKLEGAAEVSISTIAELLHKLGGQTTINYAIGKEIRNDYDLDVRVFQNEKDEKCAKLTLTVKQGESGRVTVDGRRK